MLRLYRRLSLGAKIALSVALIVLAGVVVMGFFGVQSVKQSTQTMLNERQSMAALIADYEDQMLQRSLLELGSGGALLSNAASAQDEKAAAEAIESNLALLGMAPQDIMLVGPSGKTIYTLHGGLGLKTDAMLDYDTIAEAAAPGNRQGTVSEAIFEAGMQEPVVLLAMPMSGTGASSEGNSTLVVAAIDMTKSALGGFIQSVKIGQTGYVEIIDQKGRVLLRTQPGRPLSPLEMSDHPQRFAELIAEHMPVSGTCHTCHEGGAPSGQDVLAFVPLKDTPWGVAVRQSEAEALAPVRRLSDYHIASGSILVVLAVGITWLVTRDMVRRIRRLRDASVGMSVGDLSTPIHADMGGDEIAALARTFDNTRIKLQQSYSKLEQKTREAEEAKARTQAERLKSEFISSMSHELRTPLTSIKGYSTSLLREDVTWDKDTTREFLAGIDQKADELRDLIDKLLQTTKIEGGAIKLDKEPVVLSKLVQKVLKDAAFHSSGHRFYHDFPLDIPVVEADARYLEQIVHNLVENAIKYSPKGGGIKVAGRVECGRVVVSVQDEGIGIAPEHLDKIFNRFYRVDNALSRRVGGTGLGLSIAKGLVEAHGGEIWVESTPGSGSTFYFSLPLSGDEIEMETPDDRADAA